MSATVEPRLAELEAENAKLRKIRDVLIRRVERSMDLQGSEYALFERATLELHPENEAPCNVVAIPQ